MPSSPKLETQQFLYPPHTNTTPSLPLLPRRPRRLPILFSLLLSIILIYLILPSWLDQSALFRPPPPYLSHAGKSALETTRELPRIQFAFPSGEGADEERRGRVREVIERTWEIYVREAWGWDETRPVFGGGRDTR